MCVVFETLDKPNYDKISMERFKISFHLFNLEQTTRCRSVNFLCMKRISYGSSIQEYNDVQFFNILHTLKIFYWRDTSLEILRPMTVFGIYF